MKISVLPLEALLFKLGAQATGFNDSLKSVQQQYNIKPYAIEWPVDPYHYGTDTFIFGKVPIDLIDSFGTVGLTKAAMFIDRTDNLNLEKPRDFSGVVNVGIDFHLGFLSSDMKQNFEALGLATEDAMAQVIQPYAQQNWGGGVVYNGSFVAARGAMDVPAKGQGAIRQLLAFRLQFMINVGG